MKLRQIREAQKRKNKNNISQMRERLCRLTYLYADGPMVERHSAIGTVLIGIHRCIWGRRRADETLQRRLVGVGNDRCRDLSRVSVLRPDDGRFANRAAPFQFGPLRHIPARTGGAVHQGGHQRTRRVPKMRCTMASGYETGNPGRQVVA